MLNIVIVSGRLTQDPRLEQSASGRSLCNFRIAVDYKKTADGTRKASFFTCIAWNKAAETLAKWAQKGDIIELFGRLEDDSYEKDGIKHVSNRIVVKEFSFVPANRNRHRDANMDADTAAMEEFEDLLNDPDLPL